MPPLVLFRVNNLEFVLLPVIDVSLTGLCNAQYRVVQVQFGKWIARLISQGHVSLTSGVASATIRHYGEGFAVRVNVNCYI